LKHYVIIVAAGTGTRMNSGIPKQFLLLAGRPVLMHAIQRFYDADSSVETIVVLPKNEIEAWKQLCLRFSFAISHHVTPGGETRFHSVKAGLEFVKEKSIVAVHDGVRPCVSTSLIKRCFSESEKSGNAVPVIPVNESLRKIKSGKNEIADRNSFVIIQTPQCFSSEIIKEAYLSAYQNIFTDDATVVEFAGQDIHLIEGEKENIKITYPFDLIVGEEILKKLN
jgi:2-C-methyl-D-erythritol 4-phosphate cytidylyltransferase